MSVDVASSDVIRLILQFLQENNLHSSLRALQEESQIGLSSVDDVAKLAHNITHGRWDAVLASTAGLRLASSAMFDLYEQIVIEMCELREVDTAKALMRTAPPLVQLRQEQPDRYLRLERLVNKPAFDRHAAYPSGSSRELRRQHIADTMKAQLTAVPPSRLLALLTQAVKWQQLQGILPHSAAIDLFAGTAATDTLAAHPSSTALLSAPSRNTRLIRLTPPKVAHALSFSPTASYLLTGSNDGLLELYDPDSGRLSRRVAWQEQGAVMRHEEGVMCVVFSVEGELVASGGRLGGLCVWRVSSGVCLRRWDRAHADGVSCVAFSRDGSRLLSSAYDGSIKLHGLKSGTLLREFRSSGVSGQQSAAVVGVLWCGGVDESMVVSASMDGSVRRWDVQSGECTGVVMEAGVPVVSVAMFPTGERLLVCGKTGPLRVVLLDGGAVMQELKVEEAVAGVAADKQQQQQWLTACVSASGLLVYGLTVESVLYVWNVLEGNVAHMMRLHKSDAIALTPHPHLNVLASSGHDNTVKIWK